MSQHVTAGTQTRQASGIPLHMPSAPAQGAVREPSGPRFPSRSPVAREKKPNGDPCSLTLWGTDED